MPPGYVTLYLDESGEKPWPEPWGHSKSRHYVLSGLLLTPEQDNAIHTSVPAIVAKFFPIPETCPSELHYGDIINKRGPYAELSDEARLAMANAVFDLILKVKPVLMGSVVDKQRMKQRYGAHAHQPNEYAMRATVERFDRDLERMKCVGMVIMDTESFTADEALRKMVHRARAVGIKLGGVNYLPGSDRMLKNVLNSVGFSPSQMSPGIQLADFIAYATWSHFERSKSRRYEQISGLWAEPMRGYREPSVIPK